MLGCGLLEQQSFPNYDMTPEQQARFDRMQALDDSKTKSVRERYYRSPLNYTGSKDGVLEQILPHLPQRNGFCDVFGGSGSVLIARPPAKLEVYNDKHSGLVCLFKIIAEGGERLDALIQRIEMMPHSRELFIDSKNWEAQKDEVTRAAMYYYLVQCSFAGRGSYFGRVTKGRGNIWSKIQNNLKYFPRLHYRFKQVQIENQHWEQLLKDYDDYSMVFYLDPPYIEANCYEHRMNKADHDKLCQVIMGLEGFVALSGYDNDIYNKYSWDAKIIIPTSNRVVGSKGDTGACDYDTFRTDRGTRIECLWIKE